MVAGQPRELVLHDNALVIQPFISGLSRKAMARRTGWDIGAESLLKPTLKGSLAGQYAPIKAILLPKFPHIPSFRLHIFLAWGDTGE